MTTNFSFIFSVGQLQFLDDSLNKEYKKSLSTILPLDLPLNLALSLNLDEEYWRRKCFEHLWTHVHYWLSDCSWKKTFIAYHAECIIDNFMVQKIPCSEVEESLLPLNDCLRSLKINGYKFNYANIKTELFNPIDTKESLENNIIRLVSSFYNLEEIHFYNFPINLELFAETDDILENSVCDKFSGILSKLKSIRKLSLIGTPSKYINLPKFINGLISVNNIKDLNLSCDQITDDLCEHISRLIELSRLQSLVLSNNSITNNGAERIASVLRDNEVLLTLKLDRNMIADEGAMCILQCLVSNKRLLTLDLAYNKLSSECSSTICILLGQNEILQCLNLDANTLGKVRRRVL